MCFKNIRRYSFVTTLLMSACVPAGASVTVFTDRNLWLAATSPITTLDFTGATANNGDVVIGPIDLRGFDHNNPPSSPDLQIFNGNYWGSGAVLEGPAGSTVGQHIIATLPVGIFAVGSDIMEFEPNGPTSFAETITAQLSIDSTIYSALTNSGFTSRAFIGFVSDTQISSITFFPANDPGAHLALDNFSTGGQVVVVNPAPEAATLIMCGSGILLMVWLFRRNRNYDPLGAVA
jgi:hypothetical protein